MAPKWQAKDDYLETCNCRTLCPYISLSPQPREIARFSNGTSNPSNLAMLP